MGGKDHTSHRLIAFGLSERQTVLVLYGVTLISGIAGSLLESIDYAISLILIPVLLLGFTLLTAYIGRIKVVESSTSPEQMNAFSRLVVGLTLRGRMLELAADLVIISLAYYLSFWLYFRSSGVDFLNAEAFLRGLPIVLAAAYFSFFLFGIYSGVWQYISLRDLLRYAWAVLGCLLLVFVSLTLLYPNSDYALSLIGLFGIFLFLGLAVSRSSFRLLDQLYNRRAQVIEENISILIYGADDAGVMALNWLAHNPQIHYRAIGFLDNDPFKRGRQIQGIPVLGAPAELATIHEKHPFQGIILPTQQNAQEFEDRGMAQSCDALGIWRKKLKIELVNLN